MTRIGFVFLLLVPSLWATDLESGGHPIPPPKYQIDFQRSRAFILPKESLFACANLSAEKMKRVEHEATMDLILFAKNRFADHVFGKPTRGDKQNSTLYSESIYSLVPGFSQSLKALNAGNVPLIQITRLNVSMMQILIYNGFPIVVLTENKIELDSCQQKFNMLDVIMGYERSQKASYDRFVDENMPIKFFYLSGFHALSTADANFKYLPFHSPAKGMTDNHYRVAKAFFVVSPHSAKRMEKVLSPNEQKIDPAVPPARFIPLF